MAALKAWWDRSNGRIVVGVVAAAAALWALALMLDFVEISRQPFDIAFVTILVLAAVLTLSRVLPLWGWALATSIATVAVALLVVDSQGDGAQWLGAALAIGGVLSLVARTCAKTTLRVFVLFSVLLVVLLLARVGADEVEQEAREEADELAARELPDDGLTCARDGRTCLRALRQQLYDDATAELQAARAAVAPEVLIEARRRLAATRPTALRLQDLRSLASRLDAAADGADDATAQALGTATDALRTLLAQRTRRTVSAEAVATARTAVDGAITTLAAAQDAAVTEAEAAQEEAREALDATNDPPVETDLADLVREGADAVVARSADLVVDDDDVSGHLGDIGWIVALILAMFGYRRLEHRNNLTYGAPVAVADLQVSGEGLDAKFVKESLTVRYGATDLVEPAGVPGGPALATVATTLKDSEVSGGKIAGAFVTLAEKTLFPASGITVYGTVDKLKAPTPPPTPSPDDGLDIGEVLAAAASFFSGEDEDATVPPPKPQPFRAALSLRTTNENRFLRTETFDADTLENLLDDAGAMVAADVMGYSQWTPRWASSWGPRGMALRTYRKLVDSPGQFTPEESAALVTATALAPTNGLVRLLLAHSRDLDDQPLEALRLNLQNRLTYPRFLRGRYRLTTSLSMLAAKSAITAYWWPAADPAAAEATRQRIALDLEKAATAGGWLVGTDRAELAATLRGSGPPQGEELTEFRRRLLDWAAAEADEQARAFTLPFIVANARRQSERRFWLDLLRSRTRRRAERGRVESLRAIVDLRKVFVAGAPADDADKAIRKAADVPDPSFNVVYNAACYWSLRSNGDPLLERKALAYLAVALRQQGADARVLAWARQDPDLAAIRVLPEFDALVPPADD